MDKNKFVDWRLKLSLGIGRILEILQESARCVGGGLDLNGLISEAFILLLSIYVESV